MKDIPDRARIVSFKSQLAELLPNTYALLSSTNLVVHPLVSQIVLHGSRGLAGGYRIDSDIDLSLVVDVSPNQITEALFHKITMTTLDNWKGSMDVDLAVVFDLKKCGLKCFEQTTWQQEFCQLGGLDCFGIYKIQRGFHGFMAHAGIQVQLMYPCLTIWQRTERQNQITQH